MSNHIENLFEWGRACKITVQSNAVSGSHQNFPIVLTHYNLPSEIFNLTSLSGAKDDGSDIRITSDVGGNYMLPIEISVFDKNNISATEIWTLIPTISQNSNNSLYIWYNNLSVNSISADENFGRNSVWSNNFISVYHMNGTNSILIDSTGNNDLQNYSGIVPTSAYSNNFGYSRLFSGTSGDCGECFYKITDDVNGLSAYTVESYIKSNIISADDGWLTTISANINDDDSPFKIRYDAAGIRTGTISTIKFGMRAPDNYQSYEVSANNVQTTNWQYIGFNWQQNTSAECLIDLQRVLLGSGILGGGINILSGTTSGGDRIQIGNVRVTTMCTFNILSITSIKQLLEWHLELKRKYNPDTGLVHFEKETGFNLANNDVSYTQRTIQSPDHYAIVGIDIPYLRHPQMLDAQFCLPSLVQDYLIPALNFMTENLANGTWGNHRGFESHEIDKFKRVCMDIMYRVNNDDEVMKVHRAKFYDFITEMDQRNNTNFLETFPEMKEFYNECVRMKNKLIVRG
jgi:hypothetical protein